MPQPPESFQLSPEATARLQRGEHLTLLVAHSSVSLRAEKWPEPDEDGREQRVFAVISAQPLDPLLFFTAAGRPDSALERSCNQKFLAHGRVSRRRLPHGKSESIHLFDTEMPMSLHASFVAQDARCAVIGAGVGYVMRDLKKAAKKRREDANLRYVKPLRKLKTPSWAKTHRGSARERLRAFIERIGASQDESWGSSLRSVEHGLKALFPDALCERMPAPPEHFKRQWIQSGGLIACCLFLVAQAESDALGREVAQAARGKAVSRPAARL